MCECLPFLPLEFTRQVCACVYVCVHKRMCMSVSVVVWLCAFPTARAHEAGLCMCVCVCVCVCVCISISVCVSVVV